MSPCQVVSRQQSFPCPAREGYGGGRQCERLDSHGENEHWISDHTINHDLMGNGYACSAVAS